MFQSDPYGILAVIAFATCLALATVLYRVGMFGSVAMPNTLRDTLGMSSINAATLEDDLQARNAELG